ncbi:Ldh family oxidoreductase [bacterium]|nr:Ldh family oxidoreductase [bacterium]
MDEWISVDIDALRNFVVDVFKSVGVRQEDAEITADVLITADKRGIGSHGVARLRRYVNGLKSGIMKADAEMKILKETPNTLLISGGDGLGQPVSYRSMKLVIEKAKENNVAFAAVRNSNHYGIAGYYSMMALDEDLLGISITNSAPLVVPTFGKDAVIGTNPISIAVPAGKERPIVLDMATSTVPRGKLEVYNRLGKPLPITWATDEYGIPTQDAARVLENLLERKGGGLLPLGGGEEETGGHKGYGLSVMVDVFSGILSGGAFGLNIYGKKGEPPNVCHFFGAIDIEAFIDRDTFKSMVDDYVKMLKNASKREGAQRIYIHGEKEFEKSEQQQKEVKIYYKVIDDMKRIGEETGVTYNL